MTYHRGWEGNHFSRNLHSQRAGEFATRRQLMEQGDADVTTYNLLATDVEELQKNDRSAGSDLRFDPRQLGDSQCSRARTVEARQGSELCIPVSGKYRLDQQGTDEAFGTDSFDCARLRSQTVFLYETDLDKAKELLAGRRIPGRRLRSNTW